MRPPFFRHGGAPLALLCWFVSASTAHAALTISAQPTQNVNCLSGVCTATAQDAVLNVTDLVSMLAVENLKVQSGSQAQDIAFNAPFSWTSTNALTLDSYRSITVYKAISDAGPAALTLTTNDGGSSGELTFIGKGRISFLDTSNSLTVDGQIYVLIDSIAALATAVTANPSGFYALANDYDAKGDGTYNSSPIGATFENPFTGTFNGLGNEISRLMISNEGQPDGLDGLIGILASPGSVSNLGVTNATVRGGKNSDVGILVGQNYFGSLRHDSSTGSVIVSKVVGSNLGGLVGFNAGMIDKCRSAASVRTNMRGFAGGLVGANVGTISSSFASGTASAGHNGKAGGLAGYSADSGVSTGIIVKSYATGTVNGGSDALSGGFVGESGVPGATGAITSSYSIGSVSGKTGSTNGGLIGADNTPPGSIAHSYWDLDTSGISDPKQGAGNIKNDPGITGLTTAQLKSGLPDGFDPAVWAENPKINNGYPYLLANPPPK